MKGKLLLLTAVAIIAAGFILTGLMENRYYYFATYVVLQYIVLATAWNILGGYTGYVNFGTAGFFAMGAYTAVILIKAFEAHFFLLLLCGGVVSGLLGLGIGYLTLRLRGVFFAIATLALAIVLKTVVDNSFGLPRDLGLKLVGGARGIYILRPRDVPFFSNYVEFLFAIMVILAVLAVAVAWFIENSWIGRGLAAIRDDEEAAECMGVPVLKLKLFATTVSGFLMGVVGAPFPYYITYLEPSSAFSLDYAVNSLAMPLIGGTTTWLGPVIGAVLLGTAQQVLTVTISSEWALFFVGVVLVGFVILAPEGIVGLFRKVIGKKT
ncbi:MAG: branched-chain amino acid ABC transporter permease [Nitrospinota bacterium]|nr:branched-chain amino acid ABC transporter permease [Nitrospinota bacterium]